MPRQRTTSGGTIVYSVQERLPTTVYTVLQVLARSAVAYTDAVAILSC